MNLMNVTKDFVSYKYNCCRILFFLVNIVQLFFDLLMKLCFKYCFPFSDPATGTMCGLWKCWNLFLIFPVSYGILCIWNSLCHYVFYDNKRIWKIKSMAGCLNCHQTRASVTSTRSHEAHALQWRHDVRHGVSNHQPHDCLLNRLFRRGSKKTSKLRVTGLCEGWPVNSPHKGPVTWKMFPFDDVIMFWTKETKIWQT